MAAKLNQLARKAEAFDRLSVAPGLSMTRNAGVPNIRVTATGTLYYTVCVDGTNKRYVSLDGGKTYTFDSDQGCCHCASDPDCGPGCGWAAGVGETTDLCLQFVSETGGCACADGFDPFVLSFSGGVWTSATTATLCGSDYTVAFDRDGNGNPRLGITTGGTTTYGTLDCCGDGYAVFAFGDGICPDTGCGSLIRLKVSCGCCAFTGYTIPAWYCLKGETGDCVAVFIAGTGDECDPWSYCSGPYATEDEALAVCGITTTCCPGRKLPGRLYAHLSNASANATCLNGVVLPMDSPGGSVWYNPPYPQPTSGSPATGTCPIPFGGSNFAVQCAGGITPRFEFDTNAFSFGCAITHGLTTNYVCDPTVPLVITFTGCTVGVLTVGSCTADGLPGTVDITVTESP